MVSQTHPTTHPLRPRWRRTPTGARRDPTAHRRPTVDWLNVTVWAAGLAFSLGCWLGIAMAIVALAR
jgi:hypothetical protein